jgi:hypothetical protein
MDEPEVLPEVLVTPDEPNGLPGSLAATDTPSGSSNTAGGAAGVILGVTAQQMGLDAAPAPYHRRGIAPLDPTDAAARITIQNMPHPVPVNPQPPAPLIHLAALHTESMNSIRDMIEGQRQDLGLPTIAPAWDANSPELQFASPPLGVPPGFASPIAAPWEGDFTASTMSPSFFDPTPMRHFGVSPELFDPIYYSF